MPVTIAVIGAGGIGSRHLQGVAGLERPAEVWVVEPSSQARAVAAERLAEVVPAGAALRPRFRDSVDALPGAVDVAIVATPATVRRAVVEGLLAACDVEHLVLEKFLFPAIEDYDAVAALLAASKTSAWVNCPRRMWPGYADLRERFAGRGPVSCRTSTHARYGVGTTAIHFLDLLALLSGERAFTLRPDRLDGGLADTRHGGLVEFSGTLDGSGADGSWFEYTAHRRGDAPVLVELASPDLRVLVRESEEAMWVSQAGTGWAWSEQPLRTCLQSALTGPLVADLLDTGRCALAGYEESSALHLAVLRALADHYGRLRGERLSAVPVT